MMFLTYLSLPQERDQEIAALNAELERKQDAAQPAPSTVPLPSSAVPPLPRTPVAAPRRSTRLAAYAPEPSRVQAELDQCRAELAAKTQGRPAVAGSSGGFQ